MSKVPLLFIAFAVMDYLVRFTIASVISMGAFVACTFANNDAETELSVTLLQGVFTSQHDGWSLDEVMLSDPLRKRIVDAVHATHPKFEEKQIWEGLIRLRKSGKLHAETTRRKNTDYGHAMIAAEIAARRMQDERDVTFDEILIDPALLQQYDEYARVIDKQSDVYALRKAALRLRKSRQLKPELVLRVTDWKRDFVTMSVQEARKRVDTLPKRPGIYIFRDATGFLYIGQSNNLRDRLAKHLDQSDRQNLADYLSNRATEELILEMHVFREGSPAEQTVVREAYESELIRSRKPRLNLSP